VESLVALILIVAMDCAVSALHLLSVDCVNKKTLDEFKAEAMKKHNLQNILLKE